MSDFVNKINKNSWKSEKNLLGETEYIFKKQCIYLYIVEMSCNGKYYMVFRSTSAFQRTIFYPIYIIFSEINIYVKRKNINRLHKMFTWKTENHHMHSKEEIDFYLYITRKNMMLWRSIIYLVDHNCFLCSLYFLSICNQ